MFFCFFKKKIITIKSIKHLTEPIFFKGAMLFFELKVVDFPFWVFASNKHSSIIFGTKHKHMGQVPSWLREPEV